MNEKQKEAISQIKKVISKREELKSGWRLIGVDKRPNCDDVYIIHLKKFHDISEHDVHVSVVDNGDDFEYLKTINLIHI